MNNQTSTDAHSAFKTLEHRARMTAIDSAVDVHNHLTGIAASLRFLIVEMDGPEADDIRAYALSAEAAAYQVQGVIEHLEHTNV